MKSQRLVIIILFYLTNLLLAGVAFAQDNSYSKVEKDLMYSWVVTIKDQEHPTIFKVHSVKQKDDKSFFLDATYRFLNTKEVPAEAELLLIGNERKLVVTTQSGEKISAVQVREKVFEGTYTNLKSETVEVTLKKTPWPEIQALQDAYRNRVSSIAAAEVPLPINLVFDVPPSDLRKELVAFHGKWVGNWGGNLGAILIVKSIGPDTAKVLYAWGAAPQRKISAGFQEYDAKVLSADRGEIEFGSLPGPVFSVKAANDSADIQITRVTNNSTFAATFKRAETPSSRIVNDEAIEKAIESAWEAYCQAGYCGGYPGKIIDRSDDVLTVIINGNTRYLKYYVIGETNNYTVQVRPTPDGGRNRP